MPSDRSSPRTPRKRDRRAEIACTHCRRRKKKCKQECGTSSPRGKCQRCCATGEVCEYLNVIDDISSRVPSPPPTGSCMEESESANNGTVLQLQWRHASFEISDTGQQQLVHRSSSSSGSSTHETENISNNSRDTHPDDIRCPSNWVNLVADPSLSPSRSATESAQYDQQSSISTHPSHTTSSVPDVDAQRPDSTNYYDYYDLILYDEGPRSQSNIPIRTYYSPYEEANISDPYSAWNTYHASSDGQVLSAINYPKCLVCFAVNCETHPNCAC